MASRKLKGFQQHGFVVSGENETQAYGDCLLCGASGKFYVDLEHGLWDCKRCGRHGNLPQFLAERHEAYKLAFRGTVVSALARNRGLRPQTLRAWGLGWSGQFYSIALTGNPNRTVTDIRRYTIGTKTKALSTTSGSISFAAPTQLGNTGVVWLCEGEWDGMALWEALRKCGIADDVYCAPGASALPNKLLQVFAGKDVRVVFDNDEAGVRGMQRAAANLGGVARRLSYVRWPSGAPEKFDVRDYYHAHDRDGKATVEDLSALMHTEPPLQETQRVEKGDVDEPSGKGLLAEEVTDRYTKWLEMTNTDCLDVMFGSVFANRMEGDPLWMFMVAPPGGMKSELLMSLQEAPRVLCTTSITPHTLVSGMPVMGGRDPSLLPQLNGRVLVIKDFTTILSMNTTARDEIFGQLRDAFDGQCTFRFGNGITRTYKSKFGVLAGVTQAVEGLANTNSTLGERFLKYSIAQQGASASRNAILKALANLQFNDTMQRELLGVGTATLDRTIDRDEWPTAPTDMLERIMRLARWVARLRGAVCRDRYTQRVEYKPIAEIGTRLAKQLCKLAYGISLYRRDSVVSESTYAIIVKCAQDTAPDKVEEVVKQMYTHGAVAGIYHSTAEIAKWSRFPTDTVRYVLQDLVLLRIAEERSGTWRLTLRIRSLMKRLGLYAREQDWSRAVHVRRVKRGKGKA